MNLDLIFCIIGCALVTAIPRVFPLMYLSTEDLPKSMLHWLSFVPVAVMSALLIPDLVIQDGNLNISFHNTYFISAFPAALVAWRTKSFFGTIACAMATVAFLRYIGWS